LLHLENRLLEARDAAYSRLETEGVATRAEAIARRLQVSLDFEFSVEETSLLKEALAE